MLSTSAIQDKPTAEWPTADWGSGFPLRFRSSTLAISDEGMGRRRERTLEPGGASRSANLICI
ncbi:hypothetical protein RMSM_00661 [Rhodopirellula maiorica SM1]|uniref:Uncharacterized protein n=1 Tax=Rhodopirellula maiorica SM1 TaxID=1265738 RepID=M5RT89_9BACT|nr:hypothetical protein RMSM_00661 [Rhodopirellula maiorica SM1]